jgi:hypothetical protein
MLKGLVYKLLRVFARMASRIPLPVVHFAGKLWPPSFPQKQETAATG